jgi:hypothetical protein
VWDGCTARGGYCGDPTGGRILKCKRKPKDNLAGAKRRALWTLKANAALTILSIDKGNVFLILNTTDYNQKIDALLEDQAYRKLRKDPTDSIKHNTVLLLKKVPAG